MADDVSKSAKWAKRLAVVTLVCGAVVGAAFLAPFEDSGDFSGLFHAMAVGLLTAVFGGIGLLSSVVGTVMTVLAIRKHQDRSIATKFAATVHSLAFVTVGIVALCAFTIWTPQGRSGETRLAYAVKQQDVKTVQRLLWWGANPNQKTHYYKEPLLLVAAGKGNKEIVSLLLKHGANPNDRGAHFTVMQNAVYGSNCEVIRMLLERGASPNLPPDKSIVHGSPIVIVLDERKELKMTDGERVLAAKMLLEYGADVHVKETLSTGLGYMAAQWGDKGLVQSIISRGLDVNAPAGAQGMTPLAAAGCRNDVRAAVILLELGADVNARSHYGKTAMSFARTREMLSLFYEHGANLEARSPAGWTLLMGAVDMGLKEDVAFLLEKGVDINAHGNAGDTALRLAKKRGNADIIQLLKDAGAVE